MRINVSVWVSAVLAATCFSGCSNGNWGMPNLAFWNRSPFQSAQIATPGKVGSPVRPSAIAANSRSPSNRSAVADAPAWSPPSVNVTPGTAYPSAQNPYQTTTPPAAQGYSPEYTASTAGVPGAGAYGNQPTNPSNGSYNVPAVPPGSSYGGSNAYPNSPAAPYSPPAGSSYNGAGAAPGNYPPTNTPAESYNPVRPAAPSAAQPGSYGGNTNSNGYDGAPPASRYAVPDAGAAGSAPYGSNNGTGGYVPPAGSSYGDGGYAPPASNANRSEIPAAQPSYGDSRYDNPPANNYGPSGTAAAPPADNRYSTPSNRYPSSGGDAPMVGSRYSSPTAAPPTAGSGGYTPPASSYPPPASSYIPPSTGGSSYTAPAGASGTPSDASRYTTPSTGGASGGYRPGSTSDYTPSSTGAGY